jgi:hypothetical protein
MLQETSKIWMDGKFVGAVRGENAKYRSWLTPVR